MEFINIAFQSFSFLLTFLAAGILLFVNKEQTHSSRILALLLLILSFTSLNAVFLHKAWFLLFPYLHKLILPFTLLITPVAWLYIRSVLLGELKFRKKDWLILVPTVLCIIDLFSYYTMPVAKKKLYLIEFYQTQALQAKYNEGFLPAYVFSFVRVVWSAVFIGLNFHLIFRFKQKADNELLLNNKALLRWLTILNGLLAALLLSAFINAFVVLSTTGLSYLDFTLGITVLIMSAQLFIRPQLLYGIFQPAPFNTLMNVAEQETGPSPSFAGIHPVEAGEKGVANQNQFQHQEKPVSDLTISPADTIRYKKIVELLFQQQKPFLQTDYSLEKMVLDTSIPRYILSAFINREYGMGFREFINRHRVDFFKNNLNNPDWQNLTLEAIATDCGFSSRITFIKNVKQITGQIPSDLFKKGNSKSLPPS